jgi:hypothetical protein
MGNQKLYDRSGAEIQAGGIKPGNQTLPAMAWASATAYVTAWADDDGAGNVGIRGQLFSSAGAKLGLEFQVNTGDTGSSPTVVVAKLADGGFVVAWDGPGGIRFQRFDAEGAKVGLETLASPDTSVMTFQPSVAGLANGGFVITWTGDSGHTTNLSEIRGRIFSASGEALADQFTVNTVLDERQVASSVTALPGGGFAVVWPDSSPMFPIRLLFRRITTTSPSDIRCGRAKLGTPAVVTTLTLLVDVHVVGNAGLTREIRITTAAHGRWRYGVCRHRCDISKAAFLPADGTVTKSRWRRSSRDLCRHSEHLSLMTTRLCVGAGRYNSWSPDSSGSRDARRRLRCKGYAAG